MTIKPGYGVAQVHLGLPAQELFSSFGKPKKRKTGTFREYWSFPESHFQCIVSRKSGKILSLFLFDGNPFTEPGLFELREEGVRRTFSKPDREDEGFTLSTGAHVDRWLSYNRGIGFHFGETGKLRVVSFFAPKRVAKPKAVASHRGARALSIAALTQR